MGVYHTPSQEDYNALMGELSWKGFNWAIFHSEPDLEKSFWERHEAETCVEAGELAPKELSYSDISYFRENGARFGTVIEYRVKKRPTLESWAKWIARDGTGELWSFSYKPDKRSHSRTGKTVWDSSTTDNYRSREVHDTDGFYDFIEETDLEPYEVVENIDPNEPKPVDKVQEAIDRITLELEASIHEADLATQDGQERAYGVLEGLREALRIVKTESITI